MVVARVLPWVLEGLELNGPVLEIGPGPGIVADALLGLGVTDLTVLEIESDAAERLRRRYQDRVRVETGDAADMPFSDTSFAMVISSDMLHHVPTGDAQDRIFAEARRVLHPGGTLAGSDTRTGLAFRLFHLTDMGNLVDPFGLADRLTAAGFDDPQVDPVAGRFRFRAVAPRSGRPV